MSKRKQRSNGDINKFLELFNNYYNYRRDIVDNGDIRQKKDRKVGKGKWVIYTKDGCSFCDKAKKILESKKIEFIERDQNVYNDNKQNIDKLTNNYSYFPKIFNNKNEFIGGCVDLEKIQNES